MAKKVLVIVLIFILPPLAFYGWFEASARSIVRARSLDPEFGNALKHALASSYLYSGLRLMNVPASISEDAIVRVGMLNEFAEFYVKRGSADTTSEIMKDLQNNMVGVSLAKWLEGNARPARDEMLVALGELGLLVLSGEELDTAEESYTDAPADYEFAADWFVARRGEIDREVRMALDRLHAAGAN